MGRTHRTNRHPLDGKPPTRETTDANGNPEFHVDARILTPLRAMAADKLGALTAVGGSVAVFMTAVNHDHPPLIAVVFAVAVWLLQPLLQKLWREALRRKVELVLTKDEFRFRRLFHWISFDRALDHGFALVPHDSARAERDRNELEMLKAQQLRKVAQPRRYFQDSYHLTFQLLGQRNDIIAVYGLPEARAMLTRLRAIEDTINAHARRSDGSPSKPSDQWFDGPGPIPDTADA
jgi:hypothetical protein